jgi:alpha-tubulin suppressor-like RCC1 family protein
VSGLNHVTSVTGIKSTGFAITADGSVWAWGSSLNHLLGDDVFGLHTRSTPAQVRVIRATAVVGHAGGAEAYVIGLP